MGEYVTVAERDARRIREAVDYWIAGGVGQASGIGHPYDYRESEILLDLRAGDMFSYGRHFPLCHFARRDGKHPALFILNGDRWRGAHRWNSRTDGHQTALREAVAASGVASVILPMSAIIGAGIDLDSIRPIHVREDTNWTEYDPIPADVDLDNLASAYSVAPFDECPGPDDVGGPSTYLVHGRRDAREDGETWREWSDRTGNPVPFTAGTKGEWRGSDGATYSRTFYRRASVYDPAIHSVYERSWREIPDVPGWEAAPVSSHAFRNGSRELVRRDGEWFSVRHEHRLGDSLFSAVRAGKRSRFLSSFDYNERAPLYFLAQVPRGAGETVDSAIDALAPRAVHAAYARGIDVRRQGDIFFISTNVTTDALADRGATFGRLTQWTRDAKPRAGEVNYRAPLSAAERRRMESRERRERARIWRESFRHSTAPLARGTGLTNETASERLERRERTASQWRELLARHAAERATVHAYSVGPDSLESSPCPTCGAGIGTPCLETVAGIEGLTPSLIARIDYDRARDGAHHYRESLARRHSNEREALRRETDRGAYRVAGAPQTKRRGRSDYANTRERARARVETARAALRSASLGAVSVYLARPHYGETARGALLRARAEHAVKARDDYEKALAAYARAKQSRGIERDAYRRPFNSGRTSEAALITWGTARVSAAMKIRPHTVDGSPDRLARRERVRSVLAVYGTSHSGTEVARIPGGGFYVRGIVRHVPDLEAGRTGGRDHAPITLGDGATWYLALRNRVPRQSR